jgi:hypothetical protein
LKAIGRVDGLVTSDEEVRKLMLDREAWRRMINKREDSEIRRDETRSATVAI